MSHPSCLLFSSYIFCIWVCVYSVRTDLFSSDGDMKPTNPVVEEGGTLVLNCTLTERYNETRNASWLAFKHKGVRYRSEYVSVLSDDTAQLRLPNATLELYGHFVCYMLPNRSLGIGASQDVNVVKRPMKPVLQDCRVHNWEWLECSWSPSKKEQDTYSHSPTSKSEVFWHIQGSESNVCHNMSEGNSFKLRRNDTSRNFGAGRGLCEFQMGQSYCFKVEVTNVLSKPVRSDEVCFNTSDIVWPDPPRIVSCSLSDDGKSIVNQWNPPSSSFNYDPLQLTYSLDYKSDWDQINTSKTELNAVSSVTLPGNPYTSYTVWLRVKTLSSGFWSNVTTFRFHTPERAPYQQPVLHPRGFSVFSKDGANRNVIIYWQPVPKERFNGNGFHYIASVNSSAIWETLNNQKTEEAFLEMQLKPETTDVRIIAQNDVGNCSAPQEAIHIPSFSPGLPIISPVYEVIVELDIKNSYALISWTYVSEPTSVTNVTIFWCSSSLPFKKFARCKPSVGWKNLTVSQKQYNLSSDNGLYPIPEMDKLQAGVSVDLNGIPCGIKWSSSLYVLSKVAPPPENVQVVIPHDSDHGYAYVTWEKPKCVTMLPCGYAYEFLLSYCLVSSADNEACVDKNYTVTIPSQKLAYNLTGLRIGSNYKLWMLSHSKAGLSAESNAVYTATTKPWKTPGAIVGIAVGSIIILTVIVFGLYGTFRCCNKYKKKLTRGVEVVMPKSVSVQRTAKTSTSSETQILYNSYPSGYSRQGSDMSTLSRDSGRFSLTQTCVSSSMAHQELSPIMSKSNGTLVATTITPLIGIQEDANADDVFPDMHGFDSSNYVKTTVLDDPDDESGYKFIRSVNPYQVGNNEFDCAVPEIQYKKPSARPLTLSSQDVGVYSRPDILLCATGDPNNGAYIQIQPDANNSTDVDLFCQSVPAFDTKAVPLPPPVFLPPPPSLPPGISDISYTTVEMLNPDLSFPVGTGPGGGTTGGGNTLENGYTDIAFLNNSFLGNVSQANNNNGQTTADARQANHPNEGAIGCNQPQSFSHPLDSSNANLSCGQSLSSVTDCLEGVSSDPNYAHIGSNLDWNPVTNATLAHPLSVTAADREPDGENNKANCVNVIPSGAALCDNGYVHHNGLFNTMLAM